MPPRTLSELNEIDLSTADWRIMDLINRHQTQLGWPYPASLMVVDAPLNEKVINPNYGSVKIFDLEYASQRVYLFAKQEHRDQFILDTGAIIP